MVGPGHINYSICLLYLSSYINYIHLDNKETEQEFEKSFRMEWLEKMQQESWQLELLISGLALFGIFEAKTLLIDFNVFVNNSEGVMSMVLRLLDIVFSVGWKIFFINLMIHIILRGLWIGAIGLRYVSGEINYKELKYSDLFTDYMRKQVGNYDDFIEKLEKICSVLFAYTFLLFLLFTSFVLYFGVLSTFIGILSNSLNIENSPLFPILLIVYLLFGFLVLIDLLTNGGFKKINEKSVSKVYFYIYRFVSLITLSFLYRPLLYNFLDSKYTRRLLLFSIPYVVIIAFSDISFSANYMPFYGDKNNLTENGLMISDQYYNDLRYKSMENRSKNEKKKLMALTPNVIMDKYYMDKKYASVFFRMNASDTELLSKDTTLIQIYDKGIKFVLFNFGKHTKLKYEYNNDSLLNIKKVLFGYRESIKDSTKVYRRKKNLDKKMKFKLKKDSIRLLIRNNEKEISEYRRKKEKENQVNISNAFMNLIDIEINGIDYNDSLDCKYYIYPSSGINGFLCHYSSSDIGEGGQELKVTRKKYRKPKNNYSDSIRYETVILPFVKTF